MSGSRFPVPVAAVICLSILPAGAAGQSAPEGWLGQASAGIRQAEYHFSQAGDGSWSAPNRAHDLRTRVTESGIEMTSRTRGPGQDRGGWTLTLTLAAFGRDGSLRPIEPGKLEADAGRAELDRGTLREWYVNDERGLEQGFTLEEPPEGREGGRPVVLEMALGGGLGAYPTEDGREILFKTGKGVAVVRYAGLTVRDAAGAELPSRCIVLPGRLQIWIEDRGAAYPLDVDPLMTSPSWTAESDQDGAAFGISVAAAGDVNGDGFSDVIVGAMFHDNGQVDEGRALVYLGSPSGLAASPAWTAEPDFEGAAFGGSVAAAGDVNGDGFDDVIVGARSYNGAGGAFVYLGSATGLAASAAWVTDGTQFIEYYGFQVATAGDVNADGYSDVIVGAIFHDNGQADEGAAFIFQGSASGLSTTPSRKLESNRSNAYLGWSVGTAGDVNADGFDDIIASAPAYDSGSGFNGVVFIHHGSPSGLSPTPASTLFNPQSGSSWAEAVAAAGDVNGDGYADVIIGAHVHSNGQTWEGRALVYMGSPGGVQATASWAVESNEDFAQFGSAVGSAGDVNGDGFSDVLVGALNSDRGQVDEGVAYLYLGSAAGPSTTAAWLGEGNQNGALFGSSVTGAGDINGDGYSDLIVGAPYYDNGQADEGRAFVYLGSSLGLALNPAWTAESDQAGGLFGVSVATAGDVNGDGYSDVIVGARLYDNGQTDEGRAFVYLGSASGPSLSPSWTAESDQAEARFGGSVATAGDVNGDGYSDVIVGAPEFDNGQADEGRAFVYLGSASGPALSPSWTAESDQVGAVFGNSVAAAGDVNGDGYTDVIVGALLCDNGQVNEGRAFVYLGSASGPALSPSWTAESDQASSSFGFSVATAGDVNGDGHADVIVGSDLYDAEKGRAFVYLGSASGLALFPAWTAESDQASSHFGLSVATAGDVNGDGFADVIIGAHRYDNGQAEEGRAFVYYGNGSGLSRIPRQARTDGTTSIALLGKSDAQDSFRLRAQGRTPAGRRRIRLEWEVKPLGSAFDGVGTVRSAEIDTGPPNTSGSTVGFNETVAGLGGNFYRWRLRFASRDPLSPRSPWFSLAGNNVTETKLRTAGCLDRDGDGYGEMLDAACPGATTDCDDLDPSAWDTPGEVQDVVFLGDAMTLTWDAPTGGPGSGFVYDTLRTGVPANFLLADCVESDGGPDTTATDSNVPSPGQAFYYLVRAQNGCPSGVGPLGTDTAGNPRAGRSCP